jgi:flagellar hook-length control protein FliK
LPVALASSVTASLSVNSGIDAKAATTGVASEADVFGQIFRSALNPTMGPATIDDPAVPRDPPFGPAMGGPTPEPPAPVQVARPGFPELASGLGIGTTRVLKADSHTGAQRIVRPSDTAALPVAAAPVAPDPAVLASALPAAPVFAAPAVAAPATGGISVDICSGGGSTGARLDTGGSTTGAPSADAPPTDAPWTGVPQAGMSLPATPAAAVSFRGERTSETVASGASSIRVSVTGTTSAGISTPRAPAAGLATSSGVSSTEVAGAEVPPIEIPTNEIPSGELAQAATSTAGAVPAQTPPPGVHTPGVHAAQVIAPAATPTSHTPDGPVPALELSSSALGQMPAPRPAVKASSATSAASDLKASAKSAWAAATDSSATNRELPEVRSIRPAPVQPPAPTNASSALPLAERKNESHTAESGPEMAPPPAADNHLAELIASPLALLQDPATSSVAAAGAAHPTGPASPVEQIAPVLLTLAKTPEGNQLMTVRLHPDDLGMVQVRIERTPSGSTQVEISAEKNNTLQALQRDQIRLHHTLDDAGIPSAGRTITFHITQPLHAPAVTAAGTSQGGTQHQSGSRTNTSAVDGGGSAGGGRSGYPARGGRSWSGNRVVNDSGAVAGTQASDRLRRVGLDITA